MTTPRKTASKKAPVKARTAKPAVVEEETAPPEITLTKTVTFRGREIEVRLPTAEQVAAWQTLVKRMEKMTPETATIEQAMIAVGRVNKIIDTVVVKDVDREWLLDERMDGTVTMENSASIVIDALKAFEDGAPKNRAARRAKA